MLPKKLPKKLTPILKELIDHQDKLYKAYIKEKKRLKAINSSESATASNQKRSHEEKTNSKKSNLKKPKISLPESDPHSKAKVDKNNTSTSGQKMQTYPKVIRPGWVEKYLRQLPILEIVLNPILHAICNLYL